MLWLLLRNPRARPPLICLLSKKDREGAIVNGPERLVCTPAGRRRVVATGSVKQRKLWDRFPPARSAVGSPLFPGLKSVLQGFRTQVALSFQMWARKSAASVTYGLVSKRRDTEFHPGTRIEFAFENTSISTQLQRGCDGGVRFAYTQPKR